MDQKSMAMRFGLIPRCSVQVAILSSSTSRWFKRLAFFGFGRPRADPAKWFTRRNFWVSFHPATISQDWLCLNRLFVLLTEKEVSTAYQWKVCIIAGHTGGGQQNGPEAISIFGIRQ